MTDYTGYKQIDANSWNFGCSTTELVLRTKHNQEMADFSEKQRIKAEQEQKRRQEEQERREAEQQARLAKEKQIEDEHLAEEKRIKDELEKEFQSGKLVSVERALIYTGFIDGFILQGYDATHLVDFLQFGTADLQQKYGKSDAFDKAEVKQQIEEKQ
jgi:hypothetical protein